MQDDLKQLLRETGAGPEVVRGLEALAGELLRWNRRINLTGYGDERGVVVGLFLDALALLPLVEGPRVLDIGSGAGFPGLVLALARPDWEVTLLEGRGKRVSFQKQAGRLLGLSNLRPVQGRAGEGALAGERFHTVTCKAVGSLELCLRLAREYCAPGGLVALPRGIAEAGQARAMGLGVVEYELPPPGGRRAVVVSRET
jgi:16S rRNA (guanine527-N7)-methyltransferase